jgi:hypothetical protein
MIEKITVQSFKSLESVEVDLGAVIEGSTI